MATLSWGLDDGRKEDASCDVVVVDVDGRGGDTKAFVSDTVAARAATRMKTGLFVMDSRTIWEHASVVQFWRPPLVRLERPTCKNKSQTQRSKGESTTNIGARCIQRHEASERLRHKVHVSHEHKNYLNHARARVYNVSSVAEKKRNYVSPSSQFTYILTYVLCIVHTLHMYLHT